MTREEIGEQILDLLYKKGAMKAWQIAKTLGVETRTVNSILYRDLHSKVLKSEWHEWSLRPRIISIESIDSSQKLAAKASVKIPVEETVRVASHPLKQSRQEMKVTSACFVVRVSLLQCISKDHMLEPITAVINVIDKEGTIHTIKVPAAYCKTCDIYYLYEAEYRRLNLTGTLCCMIFLPDEMRRYKSGLSALQPKSKLASLGYSVNQIDGYSDKQRQRILQNIVEDGAMSRAEIISHLEWLLYFNGGKEGYDSAREKWESDVLYLQGMNNVRDVSIEGIVQ